MIAKDVQMARVSLLNVSLLLTELINTDWRDSRALTGNFLIIIVILFHVQLLSSFGLSFSPFYIN